MELEKRIKNLVYYWSIDDRPRKQYIHVLREIREELEGLDKLLIPKDLKQEDVDMTIKKLKEKFG